MRALMRGKSLVLLAVLIISAAITAVGVYAYLTSQSEARNDFNVAHNTIEVVEEFDPPAELEANSSFVKKVQVKNTGTSDCYVRVFAEFTDSDAATFATIMYDGAAGCNEADWTYDEASGYWYYGEALVPGEITTPLFDAVAIGPDESAIESFDILVYAESVQSSGYENQEAAWAAFS